MNKRFRHISIRLAEYSLLLLSIFVSACGDGNLEVPTVAMDRRKPDESSANVTITQFDEGRIEYVLKADRIDRYYDKRILNAYKVDILAYDPKTGDTSKLKADSTIVDDARNLIYAHGNVKYDSPGGKITTKRLIWDRNMDQILVPEQVTLERDGNIVRGKNLRTNLSVYPTEMDSVSAEGFFGEEYLDW